jgi:hypothetical protein
MQATLPTASSSEENMAKDKKLKGSVEKEPSEIVFLRIKRSRYKMLLEVLEEMRAENPLGEYTDIGVIRNLVDEFLVKRGKLKV